jgi:hypothetical protein
VTPPQIAGQPSALDHVNRAELGCRTANLPHLLGESLGWRNRYLGCGKMKPQEER